MAELGTALGIVSLGIQVCQGLLDYYQAWQSVDVEVKDAQRNISELVKTLYVVDSAMRATNSSSEAAFRVQDTLLSCDEGISKLEKKLQKIHKTAPQNVPEVIQAAGLRLIYPFRKSTIEKLKEIVQDIMRHLSIAIQLLHLEVSNASHVTSRKIEAELGDVSEGMRELRLTTSGVSTQIKDLSRTVDQVESTALETHAAVQCLPRRVSQITANLDVVQRQLATQEEKEQWKSAIQWLAAPDPTSNHGDARQKHLEGTGRWFLDLSEYQKFLGGTCQSLWLHGKAGCCKTVLCSTIIDDIAQRIASDPTSILAYFYFTFSDAQKQSYTSFLASVIQQLLPPYALPTEMKEAYERNQRATSKLEEIAIILINRFSTAYICVDALDECSDNDSSRNEVMEGLLRLVSGCAHLRLLMTGRNERDIHDFMLSQDVEFIALDEGRINSDIMLYVNNEIENERKLKALPETVKKDIRTAFAEKADGMFRWAFCQLDSIKRLKILRPQHVSKALTSLPRTLDETYERMLANIDEMYSDEVKTALQWLAFSERPLLVEELVDACITNSQNKPYVDEESRDALGAILDVLSSLVHVEDPLVTHVQGGLPESRYTNDATTANYAYPTAPSGLVSPSFQPDSVKTILEGTHLSNQTEEALDDVDYSPQDTEDYSDEDSPLMESIASMNSPRGAEIASRPIIRLAHFSVREYLVSNRVRPNFAANFALNEASCHYSIAQACLAYLLHHAASDKAESKPECSSGAELPLLRYAGQYWQEHLRVAESDAESALPVGLELEYLRNLSLRNDLNHKSLWTSFVSPPEDVWMSVVHWGHDKRSTQDYRRAKAAPPLYWASICGLTNTLDRLCQDDHAVDTMMGEYDTALKAAAVKGYGKIVERLLQEGASMETPEQLSAQRTIQASRKLRGYRNSYEENQYFNAFETAILKRHENVVRLMIDAGADLNVVAGCGYYSSPLAIACDDANESMVNLLLLEGADVHSRGGEVGTALATASASGAKGIVEILLKAGADVNCFEGKFSTALAAASMHGHLQIMDILLKNGADVNAPGADYGHAIQAAAHSSIEAVEKLLQAGADPNQFSGPRGSALQIAAVRQDEKIIDTLLASGADVNAYGGTYGTALAGAAFSLGSPTIVEKLLHRGADVTLLPRPFDTGDWDVANLLVQHWARDLHYTYISGHWNKRVRLTDAEGWMLKEWE